MCGIVGILGRAPVAEQLVDSLKRLEYRGYDSAGVATLEGGHLERRRAEGKLKNLEKRLDAEPLKGHTGIGHTRWATHGKPTENNAHPHATDRVAVVHNGIIENFRELREALEKKGTVFKTETDTEIVLHLVDNLLQQGIKPVEAVRAALSELRGAFALGFIFAGDDDLMIGARNGPPLAIGHGDGEMYLGSDAIALGPFTDTISYLEDGDWVVLTRKGATIYDKNNAIVHRDAVKHSASTSLVDKANYRHFMAKEIHEQPEVVGHTLARYVDMATERVMLPVEAAVRLQGHPAHFDHGLRHRELCRLRRQILVRAVRARAGRSRCRLRIPLPRGAAAQGRSRDLHFAVRRDRRHAGRAALRQGRGRPHRIGGQRADLDDRARKRDRAADAGRSRDRRRLDQGVHLPVDGAGLARGRRRQGARRIVGRGRDKARPRPRRDSAADGGGADDQNRRSRSWRATSRNQRTCSISAAAPAIRWRWKAR